LKFEISKKGPEKRRPDRLVQLEYCLHIERGPDQMKAEAV
jgi:hypothetical protein